MWLIVNSKILNGIRESVSNIFRAFDNMFNDFRNLWFFWSLHWTLFYMLSLYSFYQISQLQLQSLHVRWCHSFEALFSIILSSLRRWVKSAGIQELFSFLWIGTKHSKVLFFCPLCPPLLLFFNCTLFIFQSSKRSWNP